MHKIQNSRYRRVHDSTKKERPVQQCTRIHNVIKWKVQHVSQCQLTEYELRLKFVKVEVYGPNNELYGSLEINMYLIWNGPSRIDLQLDSPHTKKKRVSFVFKISQEIHFKIENLSTTLLRKEPNFADDCFTFWIQPIVFFVV